MNYWTDDTTFNNYVQATNSKFAAINCVAKQARARRKSVYNCISESQALSWVTTNRQPVDVAKYKAKIAQRKKQVESYLTMRIKDIADDSIRAAVSDTLQAAKLSGHLIYHYNTISNAYMKSRVRVLCNLIWDEYKKLCYENDIELEVK